MKLFLFILLIFFFISCKEKNSVLLESSEPLKTKYIKPTIVNANNLILRNPSKSLNTKHVTKSTALFVTMQNYNTGQGLALSSIISGFRDSKGNLWFGTDGGGVSKFDGKSFTNFTKTNGLAGNSVKCIQQDTAGNYWFGTNGGGLSRYDGISFNNYNQTQGLADKVFCITRDKKGVLWLGTNRGVKMFDGKSFISFPISKDTAQQSITCITEDKIGNIWFGTSNIGVILFDGKKTKSYTKNDGLISNRINCVEEDSNGKIWFGTDLGLTVLNNNLFKSYSTKEGLPDNYIYSILEDNQGNVWFGTNNGICLNNKSVSGFSTISGLTNKTVRSIISDKSGNLWFGTYGGGINRYNGKSILDITSDQGLSDDFVNSIVQDNSGNYWFGTEVNGASFYNGISFTNYTADQGLASNTIHSIFKDKNGDLWFGTDKGATYYKDKKFLTYKNLQGLADTNIWIITSDKENNLWFGTDNGVTKYDWNFFTTFKNVGASVNKVRSITQDQSGNIWFGTTGGGVSCFNGKYFTNYTTKQGLADNTIYCITLDKKGNLWIGTDGGGISFLSKQSIDELSVLANKVSFTNISTKDGLANDEVYEIIEDAKNNIIVGTNFGFTVIKGGYDFTKQPFSLDSIEYFNQKTGFAVKDINVNAMYIDNKNVIWAGTGDKLVSFDYYNIVKDTAKPNVVIQKIKINSTDICWYDLINKSNINKITKPDSTSLPANITDEVYIFGHPLNDSSRYYMQKTFAKIRFDSIIPFYSLPVNLILPYKNNNITIDFTAIEPSRHFMVRYKYKLVGCDNEWSNLTDRNLVDYGNLYEGSYLFKLKALSPDGIWSDEASYSFKILPPWYRTWWAYSGYSFSLIMSLFTYVKWRERKLKKEKEILEEKVDLRTYELSVEKERSDSLLLNILPYDLAEELKNTGKSHPKDFDQVTVLFTDFINFTKFSEQHKANQIVTLINYYYSAFDDIITKYGIEKIKTIGDSYMCAGGLNSGGNNNPEITILAALELRDFTLAEKTKRIALGEEYFEIRIGLHTGPIVAGIVGVKKYAYDIWGDTVNVASRMERSGEPGKVNISGDTYALIKNKFRCTYRGPVEAKNKGLIDMYFVEEKIS